MVPVWDAAARLPAAVRPNLSTTIGFSRAAASRASSISRAPSFTPSIAISTTSVASERSMKRAKSIESRSASLPMLAS